MKPLPVPPRFHRNDPPTSGQAALDHRRSGRLGRDQWIALRLVREHPGLTAPELGRFLMDLDKATLGYSQDEESSRQRIGRRLSELKENGLVYREGARDGCACWWPVPEKPQGTLF